MSTDFLKIPQYIDDNANEYEYLMNEFERMMDEFYCEDYNIEYLIKLVSRFENFETSHKNIDEMKNKFLENVSNTIINRLDVDFTGCDNQSLITSFNTFNQDFNITKYHIVVDKIHEVRSIIFGILMNRGKRYVLHSKAGYFYNLSDVEKNFFKNYEVVIYNNITLEDKCALLNFMESKENALRIQQLDDELEDYMCKN